MSITEKLESAIKTGEKVTINLNEASALTGSGSGIGGRVLFDDAFAALRYANPFRQAARIIPAAGQSDVLFAAKTGNATNQTNPWGYGVNNNVGSPDVSTVIWQLPVRCINAVLPVRTAALDDINALQETLLKDIALELSQQEAASMATNNDQSGSTTLTTGATNGLRGLDSYPGDTVSAYGSSGTSITNGIHTIATVNPSSTLDYSDVVNMTTALPGQYWSLPGTAWYISPDMINTLRALHDTSGLPVFLEVGDEDGAAVGRMFGWPVIPCPYLSSAYPIYLANWPEFLTIADNQEISIQMFEQTAPGFVTIWAEKRVASSVRDPFAGVRMAAVSA